MLDFGSFVGEFLDMIYQMGINDILDIAIVTYLFYKIFMFIKDTRAEQVLKGLLILLVATGASKIFKLHTIYWLLVKSLEVGFILPFHNIPARTKSRIRTYRKNKIKNIPEAISGV